MAVRALYLGDIVGRAAREAVCAQLPDMRRRLGADFVVVNGENAAGGFGITPEICTQLYAAGADVIVTGNHVWAQREIVPTMDQEKRLLRPLNFPPGTPGRGIGVYPVAGGRKAIVLQVLGNVFMDPMGDCFVAVDQALKDVKLRRDADFIMVDVHAEATSEKMTFGHLLDGRVSLVVGTHTHVPTADTMILPGGTAYQSDVGMCGDYDSVIGMQKEEPIQRFCRKMPGGRFAPAMGEVTLCGMVVETDDATGLARWAEPVRVGGRLAPAWPERAAAPAEKRKATA
jgi:metallophosphoesterase (TIGR00282 family)